MPRYVHAILVVIEAEDYDASASIVDDIAEGLGVEGEYAFTPHYEHDNDGQRVVYLPAEGVEERG